MKEFLDYEGLQHIKTYIDSHIPTKTSQLTNDSGFITSTINNIQVVTQDEYDALTSPDSSTLYIIEV